MKTLQILSFYLLSITACQEHSQDDETKLEESIETDKLIGKTIEYKYGKDVYLVKIDTDSTLHWWANSGAEKGKKAFEKYKSEMIDNKVFISWEEANGIGVSQILDFKNGIVHNHILNDRNISIGKGSIRVLP
jgi:hypothetical protein